jgi:hypothetical protein
MLKKAATAIEIEAMLLQRVRRHPKLELVEFVGVVGPLNGVDPNWTVTVFPKRAGNVFLDGIVDRLQLRYFLTT